MKKTTSVVETSPGDLDMSTTAAKEILALTTVEVVSSYGGEIGVAAIEVELELVVAMSGALRVAATKSERTPAQYAVGYLAELFLKNLHREERYAFARRRRCDL